MALSVDTLRRLLAYNPETGLFDWLERPRDLCKTEQSFKAWNTKFSGKPAFTRVDIEGYYAGAIFNKMYRAHRVAFAHYHGHWPKNQIDHINQDRTDNRIINLRDVSHAENGTNQKLPSNNTSGVCGVIWYKARQKWQVRIKVDGVTKHLGYFTDISAAAAARKSAETKYGFHSNHGGRS